MKKEDITLTVSMVKKPEEKRRLTSSELSVAFCHLMNKALREYRRKKEELLKRIARGEHVDESLR